MRPEALALVAVVASCDAPEPQLSEQAIELALRRQTTVALDEQLAWDIQGVLDGVWRPYPGLRCVSVMPTYDSDRVHIYVSDGQPGIPPEVKVAWQEGELVTGNVAVDDVAAEFHLEQVQYERLGVFDIDSYTLSFGSRFNAQRFVDYLLERTGIAAEPAYWNIDGDTILLARAPDEGHPGLGEGWWLRFEKRWGDCLAGCWAAHWWEVFLPIEEAPAVVLQEGGNPLLEDLATACASSASP